MEALIVEISELQIVAGQNEEFGVVDENTIACTYGDCCIRKHPDGWEYGQNGQRHATAVQAYENRYCVKVAE